MAFQNVDSRQCALTQERLLEELVGGLYPANVDLETYQFTQAIVDSVRRSGVATLDTRTVKAKPGGAAGCTRWEVRFKTRRCDDSCSYNPDPCEDIAPNLQDWQYVTPEMSDPVCFSFALSMEDFRCMRDGQTDHFVEQLREAYNSLRRQINERYISQFLGGVGQYFAEDCQGADSGAAPVAINLLNENGQPNPMGLFKILSQYRRMGVGSQPVVVGGEYLDAWRFANPIFAGNNEGLDGGRVSLNNTYVDYRVDQVAGDGQPHLLTFAPGAVHPLFWYRYDGENAYASPTLTKRVFDLGAAFGQPGFLVDNSIYVQECDPMKIIYKYSVHTDLCKIPQEAFSPECGQCFNYCLNWLIGCGPTDCTNLFC